MADRNDGSIAPRRSLSGPILPPPPPEMLEEARKAEEAKAAAEREKEEKKAAREAARAKKAEQKAAQKSAQNSAPKPSRKPAQKAAPQQARTPNESASQPVAPPAQAARPAEQRTGYERPQGASSAAPLVGPSTAAQQPAAASPTSSTPGGSPAKKAAKPRRTRRARLRLVQVDAWSVMKTSFLLSIALGIVLVVAVAIIWAVLGAAGVWESINSIVQQAIGGEGDPFDIQEYAGTSRVLGFTMIVAVIDVILITAISTLGAFLYNLSAALLGGIEVTLAEDN
jgi:Transmembrane domain of unknown function (DUF3566)